MVATVYSPTGQNGLLISNQGTLVRTRVAEVPLLGRNTQGVTLIRLPADEALVGAVCLAADEEEAVAGAEDAMGADGDDSAD